MSKNLITDKQAKIIGREIGEAIVDRFISRTWISPSTQSPEASFRRLLMDCAREIGKSINEAKD